MSVRAELLSDATWRLHFSKWQSDAIRECFSLATSLRVPSAAIRVQTGASVEELRALEKRIGSAGEKDGVELTDHEVHVVYAVLLCSVEQFAVEEAFHVRMGFYRENVRDLSRGIVRAVGGGQMRP